MYLLLKDSVDSIFDSLEDVFTPKQIWKTIFLLFFVMVFIFASILYFLPDKKKEFIDNPNIILIDGQRYLKLDKD